MKTSSIRTVIPHLTIVSATVHLFACQSADSDGNDSFELRGGALITPTAGTRLDIDELDAREGYGTTLTEADGTSWFVRVEFADVAELKALGLEPIDAGDSTLYIGATQGDGDDDCRVYIPLRPNAFVVASRPAEALSCPESLDKVSNWLPNVEACGGSAPRVPFGGRVGAFDGIEAFSNGSTDHDSGDYSTVGLKWQCVEYVNRYYYQKLSHKNLIRGGHAKDYFRTAARKDLVAYENGKSTDAPDIGDMLVSDGGSYGHIAIIREVGPDYVNVIHQNWSNSTSDNCKRLTLSRFGDEYMVGSFSEHYPVQGWLRRKPQCSPTIDSVTPLTAMLNENTEFTANGDCLSTSTTSPWIADCANLMVRSRTWTQMVFSCTPSYTTGAKSGVIKHAPDGTVLENFTVIVN